MPRFAFRFTGDHQPQQVSYADLPHDTAAWNEATRALGEVFTDIDGAFKPGASFELEVASEDGHRLFSLHVTSTIES